MTAQTSEHGGVIRGLAGEMDTGGDALDTAAARDGVVNNVLHLLDQRGSVVVCFAAIAATDVQLASAPTGELAIIPGCDWPILDLPLRHGDGESFRVVVKFRAAISAAGTATYRLALRRADADTRLLPPDPAVTPSPFVADLTTTSTAGADLTTTLYFPAVSIRDSHLLGAESRDGGGESMSALTLPVRLQIWAKASTSGRNIQVRGLTARLFAGDR